MDQLKVITEKKAQVTDLECRKMHTSLKDHNADAKLCPYCSERTKKNAYVEVSDGKCTCCGRVIPQAKTHQTLRKIMNKFVHEYRWLIDGDIENKTGDVWMLRENLKSTMIVRINHNGATYETNIRNVAIYFEMNNFDRVPFPAPIEPEYERKKLKRVKWSWDIGDKLTPREAVQISKWLDAYDRYESIMKHLHGKVVQLLP